MTSERKTPSKDSFSITPPSDHNNSSPSMGDDEIDDILRGMWWAASDYYHSPDFKPRTEKKLMTYQDNMVAKSRTQIQALITTYSIKERIQAKYEVLDDLLEWWAYEQRNIAQNKVDAKYNEIVLDKFDWHRAVMAMRVMKDPQKPFGLLKGRDGTVTHTKSSNIKDKIVGANEMSKWVTFREFMGWHKPDKEYAIWNDGCSSHTICRYCKKPIMQDSQGGWF